MSGFSVRDRTVARLAAAQKTLVTTEQLARCGLSKDAIAYRVASGRLREVFQSVYSVSAGELPPLALELGALLGCNCWRRAGVVVHRIRAIDRRDVRRHEDLWVELTGAGGAGGRGGRDQG